MKNLNEFAQQKQALLRIYDRVLSSDLLPIEEIDAPKVREKRDQLAAEHFIVAVCGQMKAGKSTLLNALVFGKPVLPQDDTPMTAKNTVIRRGQPAGFEATFYTPQEWTEVTNDLKRKEESWKIFKRDVDRAAERGVLKDELVRPGGRTLQREGYAELVQYVTPVDKGGTYSPFVKDITLTFDHPWLADVTLADTPGINDPNTLRDGITKEWIHKANAVVYVSYAGMAMDQSDVDFIDKYLLHVPARLRVIAVNKMDATSDPSGVEAWIASLRDSSSRMSSIFGDDGSTEFVCSLGGLIAAMLKDGVKLDGELKEWAERLREGGWLAPDRHRMDILKTLIEKRLIENKGQALIESNRKFLESVFKRKLLDCAARTEELRAEIDLLAKDSTEQERQRTAIDGQRDAVNQRFKTFYHDLNRKIDKQRADLRDKVGRIKSTVFCEAMAEIKQIAKTNLFANEVSWIVIAQFEQHRKELQELVETMRTDIESMVQNALTQLRSDLGEDSGLSFGVLDSLIDLSSYTILDQGKGTLWT